MANPHVETERPLRPLSQRVALVTGASSGLGAHFARLLAADRFGTIVLAARRTDRLNAVAEECMRLRAGRVIVLPLDVADGDSIRDAFGTIAKGERRLDVLVNNAGIAEAGPAIDSTLEDFDRVMDVNLRGVWGCALEAARLMKTHGGGDIVNIASILGLRVANGVAAYAVSKAGVVQMTKALALEWARYGIRVNALAPGYIETEINDGFFRTEAGQKLIGRIPMRRTGQLADLDAPFRLLAHGASRYMTGAVLTVDGGHTVSSL
ncbi:MAG: SDR family oxidoreductase [Methylocystis sp.]|nr:SDR family oxidoreductase [Methylocystis sp.]MCA3589825.1 SDR family oxidoreductase [Methylocystis sp.]MCA3593421.1 SDR family oxidoreductase [Methylocystis sp.]